MSWDLNICFCLDVKVFPFLCKTAETPPYILTDSIDLLVSRATGAFVGAESVDTGGSEEAGSETNGALIDILTSLSSTVQSEAEVTGGDALEASHGVDTVLSRGTHLRRRTFVNVLSMPS